MSIISNLVARFTCDSSAFETGTQRARKSLYDLNAESGRTQKALLGLAKGAMAFIGVGAGIYGLKRIFNSVTEAAMEEERAERRMAAALRISGDATDSNISQLKHYAEELQKLTIYGDEDILQQMSMAKSMGAGTRELDRITIAAIGLAAGAGLYLMSAVATVIVLIALLLPHISKPS